MQHLSELAILAPHKEAVSVEPLAIFVTSYVNSEFRKNAVLESIKASKLPVQLPVHAVALTHEPAGPRGKASLLRLLVADAGSKNQTYLIDDVADICDEAASLGFCANPDPGSPQESPTKPWCGMLLVFRVGSKRSQPVGLTLKEKRDHCPCMIVCSSCLKVDRRSQALHAHPGFVIACLRRLQRVYRKPSKTRLSRHQTEQTTTLSFRAMFTGQGLNLCQNNYQFNMLVGIDPAQV